MLATSLSDIYGGETGCRYRIYKIMAEYNWVAGVCCKISLSGGMVTISSAVRISNQMCVDKYIYSTGGSELVARELFGAAVDGWRKDKSGAYPKTGILA